MEIKKAVRRRTKIKLAITGPSGSGKTYSALRLAVGLGGKLGVIDSENKSASLYSGVFSFDVIDLEPPFTTEQYIEALREFYKKGYETVIMDTISQAWDGQGGLLEQKHQLDLRPKSNSFTNWASITKKHEQFKSAILQCPMHIISVMRSKQEYILQDREGKQVPRKIGMAPIQRENMEYEFSIVWDVSMNHEAEVSKDRTGLFTDKIFQITEETGQIIAEWLAQASEEELTVEEKAAEEMEAKNGHTN